MSNFKVPNDQGQIRLVPNADTYGELWDAFNIDLTTVVGKIKQSKKLVKVLDEVTHLDDTIPVAFEVYETYYYVATHNDKVYKCSVDDDPTDPSNWSIENDISDYVATSFATDMVVFGGLMLVSGGTDIGAWNNSSFDDDWWTAVTSGSAFATELIDSPRILHVHRGGQETLFATDVNRVRYYNATAGHSTVTLQTDLVACCIDSGVSAVWVGTFTESGSNAYVYEIYVGEQIDGAPIARNAYKIDGRAVLSLQVIDNVPYIVTDKGHIQAFNGAGFVTVASFPFAFQDGVVLSNTNVGGIQVNNTSRPIHPKGVKLRNGSLFININTKINLVDDYPERSASGIWEYNKDSKNLTHRFSFCDTLTQNGSRILAKSGPLFMVDNTYTLLMAGGEIEGSTAGVFMTKSGTQHSHIITPEINSGTVQDAIEAAYIKARTMVSGESITLKYRNTKQTRQLLTGAFLSTSKVNIASIVSGIAVGDEITLLDSDDVGAVAHITAIDYSAVVTAITLDTAIGTIGTSYLLEIQNWHKIDDVYTSTECEYKKIGVGDTSPWVQYKLVFDGDVEMRQFISKGNSKTEL